jgi:hypothetical protein
MKTFVRLIALVVLIFVGKAVFNAINQPSAPTTSRPVERAAPTPAPNHPLAQADPPPPVTPPATQIDALAAELDKAKAEAVAAREKLETLKAAAMSKLGATPEYAAAKAAATQLEAK